MNHPSTSAQTAARHAQRSTTQTRLHGPRLVLFWIGWGLLMAYTLGVFFGSLPFYFARLQTICKSDQCIAGQPLASTVLLLHGLGLSLSSYALLVIMLTIFAAGIAFIIVGVIVWRKPDDWLALLVALALVMLVTANSSYTLLHIASWWQLPTALLNLLTWSMIFLVFCLIPDGRFVPRWTCWLVVLWVMCGLLFLFFPQLQHIAFLETIIWFAGLLCLVVALLYRYQVVSTPVERQQTKWIAFGWSATILLTMVCNLPPLLFPAFARPGPLYDLALAVFNNFLLLPIILCVALAILRYRLWDIDILINRTLVYGSLTLMLALLYLGSILVLQSLVGVLTGTFSSVSQSPLVLVASTLGIAALFQPLRQHTQQVIDRRFYRRKYDAAKTLEAFSATLRHEVSLDQLYEQMLAVVEETMQPTHLSLWLRHSEAHQGQKTRPLPYLYEDERHFSR